MKLQITIRLDDDDDDQHSDDEHASLARRSGKGNDEEKRRWQRCVSRGYARRAFLAFSRDDARRSTCATFRACFIARRHTTDSIRPTTRTSDYGVPPAFPSPAHPAPRSTMILVFRYRRFFFLPLPTPPPFPFRFPCSCSHLGGLASPFRRVRRRLRLRFQSIVETVRGANAKRTRLISDGR